MKTKKQLTLFAFIDAFGWEILQRHSFMDDVLEHKNPLGTVFGYSSTCIPTILTGCMPREHEHFSFFYYDPPRSPFGMCKLLGMLPKSLTRRGRVRRMISRAVQKYYGYTGYFQLYNMPFDRLPLFDYSEKKDLYQAGGVNGGQATIFDFLRDRQTRLHLSDWRLPETENFAALQRDLDVGEIDFAYLYLAELDGLLHVNGNHSPVISEKVAWYERKLRETLECASKHYGDVRLFVFSDHGQSDIQDTCPLIERIEPLGLRFGVDYAAVYDSTMARFWFLKPASREKIVAALEEEPRGQILSPEKRAEWGCDFRGDKYGELFFLLDPGVLLCPSFLGEVPLAGMHGYDPFDKDSVAMISSNVAPDPMPQRLDDMYALIAQEAMRQNESESVVATGA